jgi:hypothetical protein
MTFKKNVRWFYLSDKNSTRSIFTHNSRRAAHDFQIPLPTLLAVTLTRSMYRTLYVRYKPTHITPSYKLYSMWVDTFCNHKINREIYYITQCLYKITFVWIRTKHGSGRKFQTINSKTFPLVTGGMGEVRTWPVWPEKVTMIPRPCGSQLLYLGGSWNADVCPLISTHISESSIRRFKETVSFKTGIELFVTRDFLSVVASSMKWRKSLQKADTNCMNEHFMINTEGHTYVRTYIVAHSVPCKSTSSGTLCRVDW